jgi:hypothetical protein
MRKFRTRSISTLSTFVGLARETGASVIRASLDYPNTTLYVVHRNDSIIYQHTVMNDETRELNFPFVKALLTFEGLNVEEGMWQTSFCNHIAEVRQREGLD